MLQRLIAAVLGVLGLAFIGLGVASATAWRGDDTLVATASTTALDDETLVVTAPGVLEMGGGPVTATARANGGTKVVLAVGKEADVAGWVGSDGYTVISGLSELHTLSVDAAPAAPTPDATPGATATPGDPAAADPAATDAAATDAAADPAVPTVAPDPDGSDLWVEQSTGESSTTLTWTPQAGRWTLLAAGVGDGAVAPSIELSWPQTVTTPWLVPAVVVGTILLLLAIALGTRLWLRSRRPDPEWQAVETGAVPIVDRSGPTPNADGTSADGTNADGTSADGTNRAVPEPGGTAPGALPLDADDAPTIILTRRQMREATAPTPRVSLLRRGSRVSDGSQPETGSLPTSPSSASSHRHRHSPAAPDATSASASTSPTPDGSSAAGAPTSRVNSDASRGAAGPLALGAVADGRQNVPGSQGASLSGDSGSVGSDGVGTVDPDQASPQRAHRTGWKRFGSKPAGTTSADTSSADTSSADTSSVPTTNPSSVPNLSTPPSGPAGSVPVGSDAAGPASARRGDQWVPSPPSGPTAEPGVSTPPNGSRADAWRRSWGIPDTGAAGGSGATDQSAPTNQLGATNQAAAATVTPDEPGPTGPAAPRSRKDV